MVKNVESSVWLSLQESLSLFYDYCQPTHKWSVEKTVEIIKSAVHVYFHIPTIGTCVGIKKSVSLLKSNLEVSSNAPKRGLNNEKYLS